MTEIDLAAIDAERERIRTTYLQPDDTLFTALEVMVQSSAGKCCVINEQGGFEGVIDMGHLTKAIRRAQYEARRHYEELERNA